MRAKDIEVGQDYKTGRCSRVRVLEMAKRDVRGRGKGTIMARVVDVLYETGEPFGPGDTWVPLRAISEPWADHVAKVEERRLKAAEISRTKRAMAERLQSALSRLRAAGLEPGAGGPGTGSGWAQVTVEFLEEVARRLE